MVSADRTTDRKGSRRTAAYSPSRPRRDTTVNGSDTAEAEALDDQDTQVPVVTSCNSFEAEERTPHSSGHATYHAAAKIAAKAHRRSFDADTDHEDTAWQRRPRLAAKDTSQTSISINQIIVRVTYLNTTMAQYNQHEPDHFPHALTAKSSAANFAIECETDMVDTIGLTPLGVGNTEASAT